MINGEYIMVAAPPEYPGKLYRGRYCYEHYLQFWMVHNDLPKNGEIIHHKDGNKHNNNISNLEVMTREAHTVLHHTTGTKTMLLRCPTCGKVFTKEKRMTHLQKGGQSTFCSRDCANKANRLRRLHDKAFLDGVKNNVITEL